ncbi:MAG: magnesium transporter [Gammaproteobacteria bacterium]
MNRILSEKRQAIAEPINTGLGNQSGVAQLTDRHYCRLASNMTIADAIKNLRAISKKVATIYCAYVVDKKNKIEGCVSLRELLVAEPNQTIGDIMRRDVIYCYSDEDQEVAARKLLQYDFIALPIISREGKMLGVLTKKRASQIMTQEQTEDFEKLMAIGGSHQAGVYLQTSAFEHFKKRIIWVALLAMLGFVSGYILHAHEETLAAFLILALYVPMVTDTGGNTGCQASTVVIRALALGEIRLRDALKVFFKEVKVSLMICVIIGAITFAKIFLLSGSQAGSLAAPLTLIAIAITIAFMLQIITSNIIGSMLPLLVAKLKLDPATVASPALTTLVDITGLLIFFGLATRILGI